MNFAILSDMHNLLRPEVIACLQGCDAIFHGGDISQQSVLNELQRITPVYVVRSNNDKEWAENLPLFLDFELCDLRFYMTHKKKDLPKELPAYDMVIYGHSHQYAESWLDAPSGKRTLLLNPGSCGPRRFAQPITMAMLTVADDGWIVKRIDIPHSAKETTPKAGSDIRRQIEFVVRETQRGKSLKEIARRAGIDEALAEQIARLYVTHPGVTVDGIMTKMGL